MREIVTVYIRLYLAEVGIILTRLAMEQTLLIQNISDETKIILKYDGFLETHIVYLVKEIDDGKKRKIGLSIEQTQKILENGEHMIGIYER